MKAIVSLATSQPNYVSAIARLKESLAGRFDGDFLGFMNEEVVGAPKHQKNNYAFKLYAIWRARTLGYKQIFWLDSSVYAVKNVQPIFDYLDKYGIFVEDSGHWVGDWCNDRALEYFGITRDEAMKMKMLSSGFVGLDFGRHIANDFFRQWNDSMYTGIFNGSWDNHRHDQTCASIIANKLGIEYSPNCTFFAYVGEPYLPPKESAVFHLKGM